MKLAFYLLGAKGLATLEGVMDRLGTDSIAGVVVGNDSGVNVDFSSQIEELCADCGVDCWHRNETHEGLTYDVAFAAGWRWMLPTSNPVVVLHDSILPRYRGFAPLVNMLINGEPMIGVTALRATESYDAGPILSQKTKEVAYPLKIASAIELLLPLYAKIAAEIAEKVICEGLPDGIAQDLQKASFSPWRDAMDYLINWEESAQVVRRFVDAVGEPYQGAATFVGARKIRILEATPVADVVVESRSQHVGKTIFKKNGLPVVVCGEGLIRIDRACYDMTDGSNCLQELPFRSRFTTHPVKYV